MRRTTFQATRPLPSRLQKSEMTTVQLIKNNDLLMIEERIGCLLSKETMLKKRAYQVTRSYIEAYNPIMGIDLFAKSIPILEHVVAFWHQAVCGVEGKFLTQQRRKLPF